MGFMGVFSIFQHLLHGVQCASLTHRKRFLPEDQVTPSVQDGVTMRKYRMIITDHGKCQAFSEPVFLAKMTDGIRISDLYFS
jgi:hypothetical protein